MTGMTNIIEIINSKTTAKEQEILSEAEEFKAKKLNDARAKAKEVTASITRKAEMASNAEVSRYEASAKLKSKYKLLDAKEILIGDVLSSARTHLEGLVTKKAYEKTLENLIIDAVTALEETNLEIVAPKGHDSKINLKEIEASVAKATSQKVNFSISKEDVRATGGVIVQNKEKSRWVNNTFEDRLERFETEIRDTISSILFQTEEKKE
jgi:V/A-type H+-transporting ATPase subunit E